MSESIPEDVMKAAREAAAKVWGVGEGSEALAAEFRSGMRDDSGSVETAVVAILAERNRNQWQDISTAPKDGTVIDLLHEDGSRFTDEYWDVNDCMWSCEFLDERFEKFTHWMPLPAPPIPHNPTEG